MGTHDLHKGTRDCAREDTRIWNRLTVCCGPAKHPRHDRGNRLIASLQEHPQDVRVLLQLDAQRLTHQFVMFRRTDAFPSAPFAESAFAGPHLDVESAPGPAPPRWATHTSTHTSTRISHSCASWVA